MHDEQDEQEQALAAELQRIKLDRFTEEKTRQQIRQTRSRHALMSVIVRRMYLRQHTNISDDFAEINSNAFCHIFWYSVVLQASTLRNASFLHPGKIYDQKN